MSPTEEKEFLFKNNYTKRTELDVLVDMINSQGKFVLGRLAKSERILFAATMDAIVLQCNRSIDFDHLVRSMQVFKDDNLKPPFFLFKLFNNPIPTKTLAFDIAEDAIDSIRVRFIDGGSKVFIGLLEQKFKDAARSSVKGGKDAKETKVSN